MSSLNNFCIYLIFKPIRDLKPDNILVFFKFFKSKGALEQAIRNVKICDYGEAEKIDTGKNSLDIVFERYPQVYASRDALHVSA